MILADNDPILIVLNWIKLLRLCILSRGLIELEFSLEAVYSWKIIQKKLFYGSNCKNFLTKYPTIYLPK